MVKAVLVAIFCILIPFSSQALEPLAVNSQGDLHITVFITESTSFLEEWIKNPPPHALTISTINEAKYDELVYVGFAITGLNKDEIDLFEGTGKTMRHIKIPKIENIDQEKLVKLIEMVNKKAICKPC